MVVLECSWRAGTMRVPAPPGCASVALACRAAPHHRGKGRTCASLHRLGAQASRSRAALRLITGARGGRARPCTAWVRERRARVPRCASSQEQGSEVRVLALPGCASVALACHAAPHHRSKGRKCASLHCLGARASRSRATRCASSQEQGSEVRVPAPPGCASVALACRAAPHHRSKGRKHASLHRLGARASRSRVALRLITGARVGSMRPCTAWVRERRARVSRCASSQEQGLEACVPALPGCASVALACRAVTHHRSKASRPQQQGRGTPRPCCDLSCCRLWGADHLL